MTTAFLLYDDECGMCRAFARIVGALDLHRRMTRVPFAHPKASVLLNSLPLSEQYRSFHLVLPTGRIHSAGAGVPAVVGLLPTGAVVSKLLARAPQLLRTIRYLYDLAATEKELSACGRRDAPCTVAEDVPHV